MWSFGTTMTMANDREPAVPAHREQAAVPLLPSARPDTRSPIFSQRSLGQLGMFFAGAGFLSLSILITRRSVVQKARATIPRFFQQSNHKVTKLEEDGPMMAFQALNLATLNVMGFGIMSAGGLAWAFDISDIHDLRAMARKTLGTNSGGRTDEDAEREVEEWVAKVLLKKEQRESGTDAKSPSGKDR